MHTQDSNPFSLIDNRLKSIESTLAMLAAREQPQSEKKFYSIAEAATKLNVAQITLYRNCQAQKIPSKKIGSRLMIPGSFVDSK
jgi:hypothetical protein